jgi:tetratricopeptide (TPR) repeat protein
MVMITSEISVSARNGSHRKNTLLSASLIAILAMSFLIGGCKNDKVASKEDVARFVKSAETYRDQGQFRAAMLEAKNAIQKNPNDSQGYIVLSKIYNQLGVYPATQSMLESVIKKMPEVTLPLAEAYVASKKYRSALNILGNYTPAQSDLEAQAKKQILMARSSIYLGDNASFEKSLAELKALNNKKDDVTMLEAEALLAQGKHEAISAKLNGLLAGNNENVKALIFLGDIALHENELSKAEDYYTKALGLLPKTDILTNDKLTVLAQLTECLIRQGKSGEAYRYQKILAEANPESHAAQEKFNDAMELYRQGKFAEAEKALKEIREQFPQDKNTAMLLGLVEYQKGQDKQAIELFDQYIDPETSTSTIIQAAALAKFRANKMDEAVQLLKKSVESQPENAEILATYGLALLDRDQTSVEGQKALEKSLALNPKQQRLRLALAKRDFAMKNIPMGLGQLQKAYAEQPLDLLIQQTYFKALFSDGKSDLVKTEIAQFQKSYPGNSRGSFLEGWFKFVQKDYSGAQVSFEKALSQKDNNEKSLSYAGLAEVYKVQNQPQKAVATWQALIEEDPSQVSAYAEWIQLIQKLNRGKEGLAFLSGLESKTDKWQPSVVLAQLLFAQGQIADSVKHIDIALERSGKSEQIKQIAANLYQQYGVSLLKENKPAEAKTYILKALTYMPENMNYLASLIELEISQKNITEAQKVLDQFSSSNDVAAERDYLQAMIRVAENKPDEAMSLYKSSWAKKPMEITAKAIYGYYQKTNQKDQLFTFANDWVTKLPQSPQPALLMAVDAQQKNDPAAAVKWYEKTVELAPNSPASLNNLAWLYYEQKNPKALELAAKAYKLDQNNPFIIDTYGWILVENNQVNEGYELLQHAASLSPTNKEIQDHLAAAKKRLKK